MKRPTHKHVNDHVGHSAVQTNNYEKRVRLVSFTDLSPIESYTNAVRTIFSGMFIGQLRDYLLSGPTFSEPRPNIAHKF